MKKIFILMAIFVAANNLIAQTKIGDDVEIAYQNAMKGIYWVLPNIPEKKSTVRNNLIADDVLYAKVKLTKEIDGVKIESTGYYLSNEVSIKIFKSNDSLIEEGFIKKNEKEGNNEKNK